ncbi:hypothetical protein KA119_00885 [Candidatus Gracilibacteria bacterium]|nr:hypothetical protein [Candidatus Gracilibacteria bacterium]
MKKIIAIILILAGLGAGVYSVDRFMSASESRESAALNESEALEYELQGDSDGYIQQMDYSTSNLADANSAQTSGIIAVIAGLISLIAGVVVLKRK